VEALARIGDRKAVEPLLRAIEKMNSEERTKHQQRIFYLSNSSPAKGSAQTCRAGING
jgi:hypothetical protein